MANRLQHESSLYLRQHAGNPVDWYPWGEDAIAKAKFEDKPIFLSVGYSACHWCHVMEHESFEDAGTAAVMNEHFICVKVDREERPDLDQIYMTALQLLTREGGGWPLSVFLTPELAPFYAGTYFPPKDAYGRPSFRRVLLAVAESWKSKREQIASVGTQVAEALRESSSQPSSEGELNELTLKNALAAMKRSYDPKHGGFGRAPKFPHAVDLQLLLRLHDRFKDDEALSMVKHTLECMARGGIFDQIGGGFARYSVDAEWLVPHFEKMLYDNALLVSAYVDAWHITKDEFFNFIARRTLGFVEREMTSVSEHVHFKTRATAGGFFSSLDADSEGEEGKFYVWTEAEFDELPKRHSGMMKKYYGVEPHGNWEGKTILTRKTPDAEFIKREGISADDFYDTVFESDIKLLKIREKRIRPGRDEKVLTAWNGLMISALARAARMEPDYNYRAYASVGARFVLENLRAADGRLLRTCGDDQPAKIAAYLEDYAFFIEALIELYELTFEANWIASACELADIMIRDYADAANGGFFFTMENRSDLIARIKDWHDGSTPSGNSMAATVLFKLATLCDRADYREAAEGTLRSFSGQVNENPAAAAQMLLALDWHLGPVEELAFIGPTAGIVKILEKLPYNPRRLIACHDPADGDAPANIALLKDRTTAKGEITLYRCVNNTCDAPIIGAKAILEALG